jgi:hypothetical protein
MSACRTAEQQQALLLILDDGNGRPDISGRRGRSVWEAPRLTQLIPKTALGAGGSLGSSSQYWSGRSTTVRLVSIETVTAQATTCMDISAIIDGQSTAGRMNSAAATFGTNDNRSTATAI